MRYILLVLFRFKFFGLANESNAIMNSSSKLFKILTGVRYLQTNPQEFYYFYFESVLP